MTNTREQLIAQWGARCSEFDKDCAVCLAWRVFDLEERMLAKTTPCAQRKSGPMDEKDWIILRLLTVIVKAQANGTKPTSHLDFSKAAVWISPLMTEHSEAFDLVGAEYKQRDES